MFLSTLVEALHSDLGSYPLDSLAEALSDPQLRATLESSFETVLAPDNPALLCSVKAVQVLLSRLHIHWKVCMYMMCSAITLIVEGKVSIIEDYSPLSIPVPIHGLYI